MPRAEGLARKDLVELLAAAAGVAAPASSAAAARRCLEAALGERGGVSVFVDGFDELCPVYKDKLLRLLRLLRTETSARPLWVSTRPEVEGDLRRALGCASAWLRPLSHLEQVTYLSEHWARLHHRPAAQLEPLAEEAIAALTGGGRRSLLDAPLHVGMAAEAFAPAVTEALLSGDSLLRMRGLSLCGLFAEFAREKKRLFLQRHNLLEALENTPFSYDFDSLHQNWAIYVLVAVDPFLGVEPSHVERHVRNSIRALKTEKTGIVWVDEHNVLHFSHFSLVEYFAAAWLVENRHSEEARRVVRALYELPRLPLTREFVDGLLSDGRPLHEATLAGDAEAVAKALEEGANLEDVDSAGRTALHLAASRGRMDLLEQLLEAGGDQHQLDHWDILLTWTPLHYYVKSELFVNYPVFEVEDISQLPNFWHPLRDNMRDAVSQGFLKITRWLLQCGVPLVTNDPRSPLHMGASVGNVAILKLLLDSGAGVNDAIWRQQVTPLQCAAAHGHTEAVQFLLDRSADLKAANLRGETALNLAVRFGCMDTARLLLEQYDDRSSLTESGLLHDAAMGNQPEMVRMLVGEGFGVNALHDGRSALHCAISCGRQASVKVMYDIDLFGSTGSAIYVGRSVNSWNISRNPKDLLQSEVVSVTVDRGKSNDMFEVRSNDKFEYEEEDESEIIATLSQLLSAGADVDLSDRIGYTPLMWAVVYERARCVRYLLDRNADPNKGNPVGRAPLHYAAHKGLEEAVRALMQAPSRADVNARVRNGLTPLMLAAMEGHAACVQLLMEGGASPNDGQPERGPVSFTEEFPNNHSVGGERAPALPSLWWATLSGSTESVRAILKHGGDAKWASEEGVTPLHAAARKGFLQICELLLEAGAGVDAKDSYGRTPLVFAVQGNHALCVDLLFQWNASPTVVDTFGLVSSAEALGYDEVLRILNTRT